MTDVAQSDYNGHVVFKIATRAGWADACRIGVFDGSADDRRDGFIHLSTPAQVHETAQRHFSSQRDLVLVALDPAQLGAGLKWEPSRGGDLFPHYYGALPVAAALWVRDLPLGPTGVPDVTAALTHT